jgi:molybdenum cofactor cytidylyltransferase
MKLHEAFQVMQGDVVAFVGAGGKTSSMVSMGYELRELGWRVLATTTTRIAVEQLELMPHTMRFAEGTAAISQALNEVGFVFLYDHIHQNKVYGPSVDWTPQLLDSVDSDILLIEADGARGLHFKAPYDHEPVIPPETSLAIPTVSLGVLDKPLNDNYVYNAQAMIDKYGFYADSKVRLPWVAQVLRDEELGLRNIPAKARVVAFINQTPEKGYLRNRARKLARMALRSSRISAVALGSVRGADPVIELQRAVGAIVLAGGQSSRMGQPKVLLPWANNQTIIEHIVTQLIRARVDHIAVVTGHYADRVKPLMKQMGVKVAHNRSHKTGEMLSSLKAGLRAMPDNVSAVLVVLGDQPRIQPKIIYQILAAYAEGKGSIIAPSFQMRRGHPILIDRRYWQEILKLPRKGAPRDVINKYQDQIHYITVDDDSVLRDVDTPADYFNERERAGLSRYNVNPFRRDDANFPNAEDT